MIKIIKTRLKGEKCIWPDKLPIVLWAYRTMTRMPIGETLFQLPYKSKNDEALHLQLDLVDEVRAIVE